MSTPSTPVNSYITPTHSRHPSNSELLPISPPKKIPITPIRVNAAANHLFDSTATASTRSKENTPSKVSHSVNSAFAQHSSPRPCQNDTPPEFPPVNSFWNVIDSVSSSAVSSLSSILNPLSLMTSFQMGHSWGQINEEIPSDREQFSHLNTLKLALDEGIQRACLIEFSHRAPSPVIEEEEYSISLKNELSPITPEANSDDDDFDDSTVDRTPWTQYASKNQRGSVTPSRGGRGSSSMTTPPFASPKNRNSITPSKTKESSPSRCSAAAALSDDLPFTDSSHTERWYRQPTPDAPGIIIDSHHSKHAPGLCGIYSGGKGDQFLPEDCTPTRQRQILDELMSDEQCAHFNTRPSNPHPKEFSVPWNGTNVRFSGQVYDSKNDRWYIHFFPVNKKRN